MTGAPGQESRGGDRVDWARAKPGEPLPELSSGRPDATQSMPVLAGDAMMQEPQDPEALIPADEWGVTYGDGPSGADDPEAQ